MSTFSLEDGNPNQMKPQKRPLTSMTPSLVLNRNNEVAFANGATGGPKTITSLAYLILKGLTLDWDTKLAVDDPRLHHQLLPNHIVYQPGVAQELLDGLKDRGHELIEENPSLDSVSAIQVVKNLCAMCTTTDCGSALSDCIEATADGRTLGRTDGY